MKLKIVAAVASIAACGVCAAADGVVKASQFGWTGVDDTAALQRAFDSGARKVVVDRQAGDWVVRPLKIRRSNMEIVFADGVVLRAKKDEFKSITDSLVHIAGGVSGLVVRGEGTATFRMEKQDYIDPAKYEFAEWRHTLCIGAATNVTVRDLTLLSSGGDGVYVNGPKGLTLERLDCRDHNRQGISVISVETMKVRNCRFNSTFGAAPMAGLDFEPNNARNRLVDILFEDCVFEDNAASGVIFCFANLDRTSRPVSITMRRCRMSGNRHYGVSFTGNSKKVGGFVRLEDCIAERNAQHPLSVRGQLPGAATIAFSGCTFDARGSAASALNFDNGGHTEDIVGVTFDNCRVVKGEGAAYEFTGLAGVGVRDFSGSFVVEDGENRRTVTAADLMAEFKPRPELCAFAPAEVDWRKVRPVAKEWKALTPDSTPWLRFKSTFVQYVPGRGEFPIRIRVRKIGKNAKISIPVKVRTPGAEIAAFTLTEPETEYVFRSTSGKPGPWFLDFRAGGSLVSVESVWPGHGVVANVPVNVLGGMGHKLNFQMLPGDGDVQVQVSPSLTEPAEARLFDSDGKVCAEMPYTDRGMMLRAKRPADDRGGIWTLELVRVKDDCSFRIGAGAVPVASGSPEAALTLAE